MQCKNYPKASFDRTHSEVKSWTLPGLDTEISHTVLFIKYIYIYIYIYISDSRNVLHEDANTIRMNFVRSDLILSRHKYIKYRPCLNISILQCMEFHVWIFCITLHFAMICFGVPSIATIFISLSSFLHHYMFQCLQAIFKWNIHSHFISYYAYNGSVFRLYNLYIYINIYIRFVSYYVM
jgi:hypothetical protein